MANFDIGDLWWLKPGAGYQPSQDNTLMDAYKLAVQQRDQNTYLKQVQIEKIQQAMQLQRDKEMTELNRSKGMAELASHMSMVESTNGYGDRANRAKAWQILAANPTVFDDATATGIMKHFDTYDDRMIKRDAELRLAAKEGETPQTKNLAAAREKEIQAQGLDATNPEEAANLRKEAELLRSTLIAPSETIESYTDEAGHPAFRIVKGPVTPKDLSQPTVAMASKMQEGLLGAEKAMELGANAYKALSGASVGVAGQFNKVIVNEGLAQLFPDLNRNDVTEARTLLGTFNEKAIAALTAGGDKRVSDKDMQRFKEILPKMTVGESLESARKKIQTFMGEVRREARVNATNLKRPVPEWALTQDEVIAMVNAGKLTPIQARDIVQKYQIPQ